MTSQLLLSKPERLSQEQSLGLVKIFLNSALACICHTRELIPWTSECFRTRYIDQISLESAPENLYDDFRQTDSQQTGVSQEVRVLVRSPNQRADRLLDMMEDGVFEAIRKSYLDTLQIFVTTNPRDVTAVLETYTFSFYYHNQRVTGMRIGNTEEFSLLSNIQKSFKGSIRTLLRTLRDLPRLPRRRSLGMSLVYKEGCPIAYQPPGFADISGNSRQFDPVGWASLWCNPPFPEALFESAYHTIQIGAGIHQPVQTQNTYIQDTVISKQLQNMQNTSSGRVHATGLPSTVPVSLTPTPRDAEQDCHLPVANIKRALPNTAPDTASGVTRRGSEMDVSLRSNHHSRNTWQGSQCSSTETNGLQGLLVNSRQRRRRNVKPIKLVELAMQGYGSEIYSKGVPCGIFHPESLESGLLRRLQRSNTVKCECGSSQYSDNMMFCELCGTWQHRTCYGYDNVNPSNLPEEHFCYSCLLLPKEQELVSHRTATVHMRLALIYLFHQKHPSFVEAEFSSALFGDQENAAMKTQRVLSQLVTEGFISKSVDGRAQILPLNQEARENGQLRYLEPLADISHHYDTVHTAKQSSSHHHAIKDAMAKLSELYNYQTGDGMTEILSRDTLGKVVVRWGYYSSQKRKASRQLDGESTPRRRKISISHSFINIDRSSACSETSAGEEMIENSMDRSEGVQGFSSAQASTTATE